MKVKEHWTNRLLGQVYSVFAYCNNCGYQGRIIQSEGVRCDYPRVCPKCGCMTFRKS